MSDSPDVPLSESAVKPNEGNKFALVVGVNSRGEAYLSALEDAEKDARNIDWVLREKGKFTVNLLTGAMAKSGDVRSALVKLVQGKTERDFLLFYFIGHGQPMRTKDGRLDVYFVTHDFDPNEVKADATMHLSMRRLRKTLYEADDVGNVLIVLDCCYSGNIITARPDLDYIDVDVRKIVDEVVKEHLDEVRPPRPKDRLRIILTSTRHNKQAQERIMTRWLYSALCGEEEALDPNTGDVNIYSLYTYLSARMSKEDLPNLMGEFAGSCILTSYPDKSRESLELARRAREDERLNELPVKIKEQVSEAIQPFLNRTDVSNSQSFDHSLCTRASIEDLHLEKIRNFFKQELFLKEKPHLLGLSEQEQLAEFGLLKGAYPTYGALLCFGKAPQHWVSSAITRCTKWEGSDRLVKNSSLEGDLLTQYEASKNFLKENLNSTQVITREGSSNQYEIPFRVLEEALANALVHRDYTNQHSFVQVQIFDDRVEISSPGEHPASVPMDALGQDAISHPRNFQIALIFYLYSYMQEVGSGIPRMRRYMEEAALPAPKFELSASKMFKVVLYRPKKYKQASDRLGQQVEDYRLTRLLSKTSSAEVYLGEPLSSGSKVAMKILQARLSNGSYKDFIDEATTLSLLDHPNIVRILDFFVQDGAPILVMEYAPGGSLEALHRRGEPLSLDTVVTYIRQIALALQYAHDHSRLHGNVRPENMLIGSDGEIVLAGFSISIRSSHLLPQEGISGSATYMAPEQFRGHSQQASDQYALAVVVYEWLTGTPPFTEGNLIQLGFQHDSVPVPSLRDRVPTLSSEVEQVVMKALAKDPRERFESVSKFAQALEQACQSMLEAGEHATSPLLPKELSPSSPIPSLNIPPIPTVPTPLYTTTLVSKQESVFGELKLSQRNLFEVDRYFLSARNYRSFRTIGITLNILSSSLLGLWLQSPSVGIGCMALSCLLFILCVVLVRRSLALSFAVALSIYWGVVGWVFTSAVLSLPYVNTVPPAVSLIIPYLLSLLSFIISLYVYATYVQNKNALQK